MKLLIKKINSRAVLPQYMTPGAAAMDICACLEEEYTLEPGERFLVPTGLAFDFEPGFAAVLCARSGLAYKEGICLSNGIGVIDSDYRGEVKVAVTNMASKSFVIKDGMRIAQLMMIPVERACVCQVEAIQESQRGEGGFGSTGI